MSPISLASAEFSRKKRTTRRERLLADRERMVPWARLIASAAPTYPTSGRRGRPRVGLEQMLQMVFVQEWCDQGAVKRPESNTQAQWITAMPPGRLRALCERAVTAISPAVRRRWSSLLAAEVVKNELGRFPSVEIKDRR